MLRKDKILYLGLDPSHFRNEGEIFHHPVIRIIPREIPKEVPSEITHILLTSKTAVNLFLDRTHHFERKEFIAIGKITALIMEKRNVIPSFIAKNETQEGVIELLEKLDLKKAHFLFPHSSLSRPIISNYLKDKNISFTEWILYDTEINHVSLVDLSEFSEIIFTSPSTVDAFLSLYGFFPKHAKLFAIGPITEERLQQSLNNIV